MKQVKQSQSNQNALKLPSEGLILALETSGRTGSVAIGTASQLLEEIRFPGQMRHSAELFPAIKSLLKNTGRDPTEIIQVCVSIGPGSFTGLRIALTFAKTMSLAVGSKIVAIDTLDAIAAGAFEHIDEEKLTVKRIGVILDAKRGQFFTAAYRNNNGEWEKTLPDCLMTADEVLDKLVRAAEPLWLLGEGLVYYKDKFKADSVRFFDETLWSPKASQVYRLGLGKAAACQFEDPVQSVPIYLRRPDAKEKHHNML